MGAATALENNLRIYPALLLSLLPFTASAELHVVIIQGLGGTAEYTDRFSDQVAGLQRAAESVTSAEHVRTFKDQKATLESLLENFKTIASTQNANDHLALFLVGHGSYDGFQYKFNIPGPDLTGKNLVTLLDNLPAKVQLLVNASSASGATLDSLKSDSRIVITATRSGGERNATYFGAYFVDALDDPTADTDKNSAISAREAFDYADRQVQDFFENANRLPTEHPRLQGEGASRFTLARLKAPEKPPEDPVLERLTQQRDEVEEQIEALRLRREQMSTDDYFDQLQELIIDLALVEDQIERILETNEDTP